MDSSESLKRKIKVTRDLHAVVRTMKSLSAVNLRHYERALHALDEYSRGVRLGLHLVLQPDAAGAESGPQAREGGRLLGAVVFGSDQGLCGQFNERIAAYAADALLPAVAGAHIVAVGERVAAHLEDRGCRVERRIAVPSSTAGTTPVVQELLLQVDEWRAQHGIGKAVLYFNRPASGASFVQCLRQLLPIELADLQKSEAPEAALSQGPAPAAGAEAPWDRAALLPPLVREHLFVTLYQALVQSIASENLSRFTAMQAAEHNVEEALRELRTRYHLQRQTAVTAELLDIVAGFEALH
jgi:F-type H+-transporting ATPase subunit gamma